MIDLSKYEVDPDGQVATMTIMDPETWTPLTDEEGNTAQISLYGPDSTPVKKARRKIQDQAISQVQRQGRRKANISSEQLEKQSLEVLVAATADWENLVYRGEELECTPANVRKIYENVPVIREQVDEFINDRSNFLGE